MAPGNGYERTPLGYHMCDLSVRNQSDMLVHSSRSDLTHDILDQYSVKQSSSHFVLRDRDKTGTEASCFLNSQWNQFKDQWARTPVRRL